MKKNVMMRLASFLLVAVLISTSAISGTYAKYVTDVTTNDSARVARWGVEFVTESDLFATEYEYHDVQNGVAGKYSVMSKAGGNVVAPGTAGEGYNFTTTGDPEVSYMVTFDVADGFETIHVDTYYPVVFTLKLAGNTVATSASLNDVVTALEKCQYMYDVTEEKYYISDNGGSTWVAVGSTPVLDLSWAWEFEVDDATDVLDTKLGNLAAGYSLEKVGATTANLEVAFTVTATATQID